MGACVGSISDGARPWFPRCDTEDPPRRHDTTSYAPLAPSTAVDRSVSRFNSAATARRPSIALSIAVVSLASRLSVVPDLHARVGDRLEHSTRAVLIAA